MKRIRPTLLIALVAAPIAISSASAAEQSLASTLDVYVFPKSGQSSSQQSEDEATCYQWATDNTGVDPFEQQKQAEAAAGQAEQQARAAAEGTRGSGARGALGGAGLGALIGEIASDDAGKGAAWGAGVGAIMARHQARRAQETATAESTLQAASSIEASAADVDNFKKAMSVCLEAKDYLVKY